MSKITKIILSVLAVLILWGVVPYFYLSYNPAKNFLNGVELYLMSSYFATCLMAILVFLGFMVYRLLEEV